MDGFAEWAARHCLVFGLQESWQRDMVKSWESVFDAAGYGAGELDEATEWLAAHAPPSHPREHLRAVQERVRTLRAVTIAQRQGEDDPGNCPTCGGTGFVVVPDLRGVQGDFWAGCSGRAPGVQFYTGAVTCSCERGRFKAATDRKGRAMATLAAYEEKNPLWREQVAAREAELAAAAKARQPRIDGELAKSMTRVWERRKQLRDAGPPE